MTTSVVIDGKSVVFCDGCEKPSACTQQDSAPDNGWVLPYQTFGYYSGFTDDIEVLFGQKESRNWILCHDCVVKILEVLPMLGATIDRGSHLCDAEIPCCKWSWKPKADGESGYLILNEKNEWIEG